MLARADEARLANATSEIARLSARMVAGGNSIVLSCSKCGPYVLHRLRTVRQHNYVR